MSQDHLVEIEVKPSKRQQTKPWQRVAKVFYNKASNWIYGSVHLSIRDPNCDFIHQSSTTLTVKEARRLGTALLRVADSAEKDMKEKLASGKYYRDGQKKN